jgi:hypothetical protein
MRNKNKMRPYSIDSIIDDTAVLKSIKRHCMKTAYGLTQYEKRYNAVEMIVPIAKNYEQNKISEMIYFS